MNLPISLVIWFFLSSAVFGQTVDSLRLRLADAGAKDSVDILLQIMQQKAPYKGEEEGTIVLAIAQRINYIEGEALALQQMGRLYTRQFKDPDAIDLLLRAKAIRKENGPPSALLSVLLDLTGTYRRFNYYKEALDQAAQSIALAEQLQDDRSIGKALWNQAIVYFKLEERTKSRAVSDQALGVFEKVGDAGGMIDMYVHLSKLQEEKDSLQYYLEKAYMLVPEIPDVKERTLAEQSVLSYLVFYYSDEEQYLKLETAAKRVLEIAQSSGDKERVALMQFYLALVNQNYYKNYSLAASYADSNLQYEISIGRYYYVINGAKFAADIQRATGNYEKALEYAEVAMLYQDSMYTAHRKNDLAELEKAYELERKDQQILLLNQQKRNRMLAVSLLGSFLLTVVGFFLYRQRNKSRQQAQQIKYLKIKEQLAVELQKLDEMKSRFFANVAHELRTPITLILGPLSRMIQKKGVEKEQLQQLKRMHRSGQKLHELVEEILDLSKLETQALELTEAPVSLYHLIRRVFSTFESYAQYHRILLQLEYQANAQLRILTDVGKLEKVLNNLLTNALKYTPSEGKVTLIVSEEGGEVAIAVKDTGRGIHPEDIPHLFDRFYQAHHSGPNIEGGTGIGLAICKEYAAVLGGSISVASTLGEGSTFTCHLPKKEIFAPEEQIENVDRIDVEEPVAAAINQSRHTVMVVEDNVDMQKYLAEILSPHYQIVAAFNGLEALRLLEQHPEVKAILSDVMMPQMDGIELLQRLKASSLWQRIPIVMLTAKTQSKDRLQALRIGVDDYLAKPFVAEELIARMQNLLQNYEQRISWQKEELSQAKDGSRQQAAAEVDADWQDWLAKLEKTAITAIGKPTFNINFIAQEMEMSERQFYRKMKIATGLTPNQYLREIRLQQARQMIEEQKISSIKKISEAIGFSTPSYFVKLYFERFGIDLSMLVDS